MTTVTDLLEKFEKLDVPFEVEESLNDSAERYVGLQKEQLFSGLNEQGKSILPEYTTRTKKIKARKGQPTDRVTLKDTGDFYNDIFLDVRDKEFVIDSADKKSGQIQKKYGQNIFGLTDDNQVSFIEETLKPLLIERIENVVEL
jgi:hypothetical protein